MILIRLGLSSFPKKGDILNTNYFECCSAYIRTNFKEYGTNICKLMYLGYLKACLKKLCTRKISGPKIIILKTFYNVYFLNYAQKHFKFFKNHKRTFNVRIIKVSLEVEAGWLSKGRECFELNLFQFFFKIMRLQLACASFLNRLFTIDTSYKYT